MRNARLLLLGLFFVKICFGQQDPTLKNILPPSPEATAFIKHGTYQVGTYTGKPDISLPLYEINTGKLSMPVSLSYDATGVRVNDMASWVGSNWSLNAGGMVSCVIVGQPDISTLTSLEAVPPRASTIVNNQTYFNYLKGLCDGDGDGWPLNPDTEPDRYYYSIAGESGSFVFDENRNIVQIPQTSVKIISKGYNLGFDIIDKSGTKYIFNVTEITQSFTYNYAGSSPNASSSGSTYKTPITAYYLSEIISNDGNEHIYFSYENENTSAKDETYSETWGDKFTGEGSNKLTHYREYRWTGTKRIIGIPRIKTITFVNGKIEFTRVSGRLDEANGTSRLQEITIYRKVTPTTFTKVNSFELKHGYFYSSLNYGERSGLPNESVDRYRLRLDSIIIKNAGGQEVSRYAFNYNSVNLPPKTSYSQDWQGYYNGKSNSTLVPSATVINNVAAPETIGGADRSSEESYMKAGSLEKITFPTGGYTVFETESHKMMVQYQTLGESHQATATGQQSVNPIVQTFTAPSNPNQVLPGTGKISITIGPYSSSDPVPYVKIKDLTTGSEQTYYSSNMSSFYSNLIDYTFSNGHSYQLTAYSYSGQSYAMASITALFQKEIYSPHQVSVGGLRIKTIKSYTEAGNLAFEENYKYGVNEDGNGVYVGISGNTNISTRNLVAFFLVNYNLCSFVTGKYTLFSSGMLYDQAVVQGSSVVYTDVVKYYGTTTNNSGKSYFNYGAAADQKVVVAPLPSGHELANSQGVIVINDSWKKGLLKIKEDYRRNTNGTYSLVQRTENQYDLFPTDTVYGLVARTKSERIVIVQSCLTKSFSDYAYADYPIYTGFVQLKREIKELYSPDINGLISTTTDYGYDNNHKDFITSVSSTNSKGQVVEQTRKYPFNKAELQATASLSTAENTAIDEMVNRNLISPIMEEINKSAGVQIWRQRLQFEYVSANSIAPVAIRFQKYSNPLETRVLFSKYDATGNLQEQHMSDNVLKSYVWDYENSLVIAEATNASYDRIAYTSFESNGTGGWTFNPGYTIIDHTEYVVTGRKSYSGTISKTVPTGNYIVTMWSIYNAMATVNGVAGTAIVTNGNWQLREWKLTNVSAINIAADNIDELRLYPEKALMATYSYDPLVGVTSQCDVNNRIIYYDYDAFNRLSLIRDEDKNIVKKICYNYAGQAEDCGVPVVTTVTISSNNLMGISNYQAVYTNTATSQQYVFNIPASGLQTLGTIPSGTYNLTISRTSGFTAIYKFGAGCNGATMEGTVGQFNNIIVSSSNCNTILIDEGF